MNTVATTMAHALERHGVEVIFGQSLPTQMMLAAESDGVRQLAYRTENAGGAMADGYARVARRVGVVSAQNGPAAVLLVAPLAEALKASVPVVALVQDIPRSGRERNAFQEFDHRALFAPCAKWVGELEDPARVDDYVDLAFRHAVSGRPGPAVLLVPKDLLAQEAPEGHTRRRASVRGFPVDRVRPSRDSVEQAVRALSEARRPVVIAGGGVHLSGAAGALARLQDELGVPVGTTTMGKGAVDESHPLSLGVVGSFMGRHSLTRSQREFVGDADVVLLIGTRTNENGTDTWRLLPQDAIHIHLDVDGVEIGRNYDAIRLVGDARLGIEDLIAAVGGPLDERRRPPLEHEIARARERDTADAEQVTASDASPIRPERVMGELDRLITPDTIVVSDASYSSIWPHAYLHARRAGQRFIAPRGLAGLGWGLPLALGAQVAAPEAPIVCVAGDGGLAHCWSELETAVRHELPVTVIVLNNGILGYQKHAELHQFGDHTSAIPLGPIDHVAIARAVGAHGVRADEPRDLAQVLGDCIANRQPTLVEVITEPDAYPPITEWDQSEALTQVSA